MATPHQSPAVSGFAITSLVCGILGFFTVGLIGIIAVILGHMGLSRIKKSGGSLSGRGFAIAGLITGYLSLLLTVALGAAIFALKGISASAKIRQAQADFSSFQSALEIYKLTTGTYPTDQQGLEALVEKPSDAPVPQRWKVIMNRLPLDAWKNSYGYHFPGRQNAVKPEITSKGPDGIEGSADDLSSQSR
jgi:general secretion pathway protein G